MKSVSPFCALGIDVGGTKIAAGVVRFPENRVSSRRTIPTAATRGGEAVLADTFRLAQDLVAEAGDHGLPVQGIGLGVCELVDLTGAVVSANCVAWRGIPVQERFASLAPTTIEADVRAAALAEATFGTGRSSKCFLYVTIGTGISSCLVLDEKPFAGARCAAGTLASSPLPIPNEISGGIVPPTLEEFASGPALVARYNRRAPHGAQSAESVLAAVVAGDTDAISVVRSGGELLGASIGWLVNVLDPELVVVGGGLGLSGGLYWDALVASARQHIWSDLHRELPILPAATGLDAGLIGAAAAAWRKASRA